MKITKRIPLEAYAYEEIEFESLEEYEKEYPKFVQAHKRVREIMNFHYFYAITK